MNNQLPPWISLSQAQELGGFPSQGALQMWLLRWNQKHTENPIRRRWGKVYSSDYELALQQDAKRFAPSGAEATQ